MSADVPGEAVGGRAHSECDARAKYSYVSRVLRGMGSAAPPRRDSHRSARGSSSGSSDTCARIRGPRACTYRTFDGCRASAYASRIFAIRAPRMARLLPPSGGIHHPRRSSATRANTKPRANRTRAYSLSPRDERVYECESSTRPIAH